MGEPNQRGQTLSDRIILGFAVTLGAGVMVVAVVLAIAPDTLRERRPRTEPSHAVDSIRLEDFQVSNYGGENNLNIDAISSTLHNVREPVADLIDFNGHSDPTIELSNGQTMTVQPDGYTVVRSRDGQIVSISENGFPLFVGGEPLLPDGPEDGPPYIEKFRRGPNGEIVIIKRDGTTRTYPSLRH